MVYSTCSILKEENESVIEKFLKEHSNFKIQKINLEQKDFVDFIEKKGFVQIFQNEKTDGFFICKIQKM